MKKEALCQIEQIVGYKFKDRKILKKAFTHSSSVDDRKLSNERLEFFGDSILGLVICQKLFEHFPDHDEGELTKIKSMLVSRKTCSEVIKRMGLAKYLKLGKGMISSRAVNGSMAAGLLESLIAAICIDGGIESARDFILKNFEAFIINSEKKDHHGNYKSILQSYAQKMCNTTPHYELLDEKGPDHIKCFETEVIIAGRHFESAWGMNKKEAEQKAAYNAMVELELLDEDSLEAEEDYNE
ncbi:MAG: ribonuclease III [Planctomycetes bacterium]|nr:ribonuclease III [Planctomycetota bacterium]MBL7106573.1 ribonuclease III [Phycisphaerae bacterium]